MGRTSRRLDGKFEPHERVAALQEKHRKLRANIDAAYDDKLNGKIAEDFWLRRTNGWQEEIAKVAAEINDLQTATFDSFAQADELMKLCRRAPDRFQQQDLDEQARLIRLIESTATFDGETLTPRYKEPFDALAEGLEDQTGGPDDPFKRTLTRQVIRWAGGRIRKATPAAVFALAA